MAQPQSIFEEILAQNPLVLDEREKTLFLEYYFLSQKWGEKINLTANLRPDRFFQENILDPLLAFRAFKNSSYWREGLRLIDVGCGGGYVGVVWKILDPSLSLTSLDSDRKKINFCKQVMRELALSPANAWLERAEACVESHSGEFDVVVSRATWDPLGFVEICKPLVRRPGVLVHFSSETQALSISPEDKLSYTLHPAELQRHLTVWRS